MKTAVTKTLLAIAVSGVIVSPAVYATNGYFSHGYSTKEKGLAGAGTAFSQDSMAAATNPAGMAFVGERMDAGIQLFSPSPRGYTVTGSPPVPGGVGVTVIDPGTGGCFAGPAPAPDFTLPNGACAPPFSVNTGSVESDNDFFLIPSFGYNWQLSSDSTVGVSVYGNGGMDTEYKSGSATLPDASTNPLLPIEELPGTYGAGTAGVELSQLFINVSFSKKINEKHAFGGGLILAGQRFSAQGLENFGQFSLDPNNLSANRHSYSYGAGLKFGYQGEVSKGIRAGVSYQSKIAMSEFDEYAGLFAEGGDFDIPSTYNIGVSFDVGPSSVIVADIQRINYSDVASISNPISRLTDGSCINALNSALNGGPQSASGAGCLGGANGAGFGWDDMTIFKIGYQVDVGDNTYRVGYSHSDQPIPDSETLFNILAPATIQDHITAGMTMKMPGNQEFNISAMYAPSESVKGANPFDGGATQIEIEMSQWDIQAGWAWKY
jgi:long-chain fatty acid transport protein